MFRYFAFALSIEPELELPGLPPGGGDPGVTIRLGDVPRTSCQTTMVDEVAIPRDLAWVHIRGGREIIVDPLPDADPDLLRSVLLGRIMSFLMRQRGWLPLHASGVVMGGMGVLFMGPPGAGKSSTAAACHARGHLVIADDLGAVRVVDGVGRVQPAWSCLKLCDDAVSLLDGLQLGVERQAGKQRFRLGGIGMPAFFPLNRIYFLEYGDGLRTETIAPPSAMMALDANSFIKRWRMEREAMASHLRHCAAVSTAIPIHRLIRPRSLGALPELVHFLERDLAATD